MRPPPRRRRGPWRWVGLGALAFLGLVVLVIAAAVVWLHTGAGAQKVASFLVAQARDSSRGQLAVRTIEIRGFLTICANDVELRDPDGNPAVAADRLCLHVNPLALNANKVLLSDVELVRPRIDIAAVETPDGKAATTLSRAL